MGIFQKADAFPFILLPNAICLLRIGTAVLFAAHAVIRVTNWTIPQFALFMGNLGFPFPMAWVWAITIVEFAASLLLIANRFVRPAAAALFAIAATGIFLIHRHFGWFVGEHGTGGSEYSVALLIMLLVIAAADRHTARSNLPRPASP